MSNLSQLSAVQTAEKRLASLQAAVVGGDKTVTSRDLADAKNDIEFAQLQQQATERAEAARRKEEQWQQIQAVQTQLAELDPKTLDPLRESYEAALAAYLAGVAAHNARVGELDQQLTAALGWEKASDMKAVYGPQAIHAYGGLGGVTVGSVSRSDVDPKPALKEIEQKLLSQHFPLPPGYSPY